MKELLSATLHILLRTVSQDFSPTSLSRATTSIRLFSLFDGFNAHIIPKQLYSIYIHCHSYCPRLALSLSFTLLRLIPFTMQDIFVCFVVVALAPLAVAEAGISMTKP